MNKLLFVAVLATLLVFSGCFSHAANEPFLLGQLTAPQSEHADRQARHGVELAVEELNRGDNPPLGRRVKVIHVETRPDAKQAEAEAVRLLAVNRVAGLLCDLPREESARVGIAARSSDAAVVTSSSFPGGHVLENVVATGLAPADQGQALARFVKDGLEPCATELAILSDGEDERSRALIDAVSHELKDTAVNLDRLTFRNESDLPSLVDELAKRKPGAVLLVGTPPELVGRLRGKLSAGASGPGWLYAGEEWQASALAENAAASRGVYYATAYVVENGTQRGQEFARNYRERFQEEADVHAALAYDDARLLFEALGKTKAGTAPQIRDALLQGQAFDSVTGPITFKDHVAHRPVFVARLDEKGVRLMKKYDFAK